MALVESALHLQLKPLFYKQNHYVLAIQLLQSQPQLVSHYQASWQLEVYRHHGIEQNKISPSIRFTVNRFCLPPKVRLMWSLVKTRSGCAFELTEYRLVTHIELHFISHHIDVSDAIHRDFKHHC